MRCVNYEGLCDLWDDFSSAVIEEKVNLSTALVCQVEDIYPLDDKFMKAKVNFIGTDGSEGVKVVRVPINIAADLERIGCFYEIDKVKYIPVDDVRCRCLYDYFGITSDMAVTGLSEIENSKLLASQFRNFGRIYFIHRKPKRGFCYLIGMKSVNSTKLTIMDVVNGLLKHKPEFFTDYLEQNVKKPALGFKVMCRVDNCCSKNDIPLYIAIYDNVSGRKSMRISIIADIDGCYFILDSKEINHRILYTGEMLADEAMNMLKNCMSMSLHVNATAADIETKCLQYIPTKGKQHFSTLLSSSLSSPLKTAYDIMSSDIFNPKQKEHKTQDYDGGKGKYEIALGSVLTK